MDLKAIRVKRKEIEEIARRHGAYNLRVFGSVARGDADQRSDLDLLVDVEKGRSLLDLGGFLSELETLLGRRVDVVTEKGLKSRIRKKVLSEALSL